jgi:hypothetical protein
MRLAERGQVTAPELVLLGVEFPRSSQIDEAVAKAEKTHQERICIAKRMTVPNDVPDKTEDYE